VKRDGEGSGGWKGEEESWESRLGGRGMRKEEREGERNVLRRRKGRSGGKGRGGNGERRGEIDGWRRAGTRKWGRGK